MPQKPFNFIFAPLVYFFVADLTKKPVQKWQWHLLPFVFYLLYCCLFFFQSESFKFNAFRWSYHPHLPELPNKQYFSADPWCIKYYVNVLANLQFLIYLPFVIKKLKLFLRQQKPLNFWQLLQSKEYGWLLGIIFLFMLSYAQWMYKNRFYISRLGRSLGNNFKTLL